MLHRIQWPSLKALGLIILFSLLFGFANTTMASFVDNPFASFGIFVHCAILTAVVEWYVFTRYTDFWTARRMALSNLLLIALFFLSLYFSVAAPQILDALGEVGKKEMKNPLFGFSLFIAQLKYACVLFPIRYNKKYVKHKTS